MASFKGVTIKNLKKYIGMEGPAYQGTVYIDNKKVGFWSQDGDGAIVDRFDFDTDVLESRKTEYYVENPAIDELALIRKDPTTIDFSNLPIKNPNKIRLETFMDDLVEAILHEKDLKKANKAGYKYLLQIGFYTVRNGSPIDKCYWTSTKKDAMKLFNDEKKKYPQAYFNIYDSPDDFVK